MVEVVENYEINGIKLGVKVRIGYFGDKIETIIGVDGCGDFLITNSKLKRKLGITIEEEFEAEDMINVKILKGYEKTDALHWSWAEKEFINIEEV